MAQSRRAFLKTAGVVGAAAVTGGPAAVRGARAQTPAGQTVRTVQTPVLDIGYEESGDSAGFPIILLHGFPYDVRSWDGVVPPLAEDGYRVLVPYLRGYGPTRFRDPAAPRMAGAGRHRPGCRRLCRRAWTGPGRAGWIRLGQSGRLHHRHFAPRAGARAGGHRRLLGPEHRDTGASGARCRRGAALVSVVLQHGARAGGARGESA